MIAKTYPTGGAEGISLILVETDRDGFRGGGSLDKIGQRGQDRLGRGSSTGRATRIVARHCSQKVLMPG